MGILWFPTVRLLVGDAHHLGRRLVCALARPLFLAVFDERQIGAENLHAAKKLF